MLLVNYFDLNLEEPFIIHDGSKTYRYVHWTSLHEWHRNFSNLTCPKTKSSSFTLLLKLASYPCLSIGSKTHTLSVYLSQKTEAWSLYLPTFRFCLFCSFSLQILMLFSVPRAPALVRSYRPVSRLEKCLHSWTVSPQLPSPSIFKFYLGPELFHLVEVVILSFACSEIFGEIPTDESGYNWNFISWHLPLFIYPHWAWHMVEPDE